MSYRSVAAAYNRAARQTKRYLVTLVNGDVGTLAAADPSDAEREAARWAKVRKSTVAKLEPMEPA